MTQPTPHEHHAPPGGISVSDSSGVNIAQGSNTVQGNDNQAVMGTHNQVQQQGAIDDAPLTKETVLQLFEELNTLIKTSSLPDESKNDAMTFLNAAKTATEKDKPTDIIKTNFVTVAETLTEASKTVEAGKTFWETAKPIMEAIGKWLGIATFSALL